MVYINIQLLHNNDFAIIILIRFLHHVAVPNVINLIKRVISKRLYSDFRRTLLLRIVIINILTLEITAFPNINLSKMEKKVNYYFF